MSEFRAIQTRYKGYRFRSRLEARWAVFFDSLGMKWEYEKQGYALPDVGNYLPDFWLPDLGQWIEIKGALPALHWMTTEEEEKVWSLSAHSRCAAWIFFGLPDFETPYASFDLRPIPLLPNHVELTRGIGIVDWCPPPLCNSDYLGAAIDAAKSARFEFGEKGDSR